jgi:signal recognition particle subunit SRP54
MFESLSEKLQLVFKKVRGHGTLNEQNIHEALREVRLALLEADVHFKVAKEFIESVKEKAMGEEVLDSLTPGQQFIKIVHQELIELMGGRGHRLNLRGNPAPVMMVGLQGSGKTTTAAKLARWLMHGDRRPLLVPADIYRPAAVEQLVQLGETVGCQVYTPSEGEGPVEICVNALQSARQMGLDTVIMDTAGRLHIDEPLMEELREIKEAVSPGDILFVADAMTGQDAVKSAQSFHEKLGLTGVILTKLDGDARGGAALSIRAVTQCPIVFVGVGEKLDALEAFHPDRMASRILGMGDVLTLIEKAQAAFDEKEAKKLERKIKRDEFTLEDFLEQIRQLRRMGPLDELMKMIPGMGRLSAKVDLEQSEKELKRIEAIINSMTPQERRNHTIINGSRRRRIAKGSGTTVQDVNRLLKNYVQMRKMMKRMGGRGRRRGVPFGLPFSGMR